MVPQARLSAQLSTLLHPSNTLRAVRPPLRQTVIFIHKTLLAEGLRAVLLHGKRSQAERAAAVADFKAGKAQVRARLRRPAVCCGLHAAFACV